MVALDDLTDDQRSLLDAIVAGGKDKLAWISAAELEAAGHAPEVLPEAHRLHLIDIWMLKGTLHLTLNPFGAWLMGVKILERTTIIGEELEEDPYWAESTKEAPSIHLPKRRHEIRWPWMDELPDPDAADPAHGPEYLVDEVSGATVELFTQLSDGREVAGIKIRIDRRLKGAGKAKASKRRKAG